MITGTDNIVQRFETSHEPITNKRIGRKVVRRTLSRIRNRIRIRFSFASKNEPQPQEEDDKDDERIKKKCKRQKKNERV